MVIERGVREQPQFNANEDMATMMANMQARLEDQVDRTASYTDT